MEIVRRRMLGELAKSGTAPVRMLCAPHGSGKTTALRQFAALNGDAASSAAVTRAAFEAPEPV
jgi:ATP/maltotriose-dependent transcriptional regulator MalT